VYYYYDSYGTLVKYSDYGFDWYAYYVYMGWY
jgi:hypothetical protein